MNAKQVFLILFISLVSTGAHAHPCHTLVVTHPHARYDLEAQAQAGIIEEIREHTQCGSEIYLLLNPQLKNYLPAELQDLKNNPHLHLISSSGGENQLFLKENTIELVGGYFELCHWFTVMSLIINRKKNYWFEPFTVLVPMKATYSIAQYGSILLQQKLDDHLGSLEKIDDESEAPSFNIQAFQQQLNFEASTDTICLRVSYRNESISGKNPSSGCKTDLSLKLLDSSF